MANMKGTNNGDILLGLIEDDRINGMGGDDMIVADFGNDTLIGGLGNDTLEGAFGEDTASYAHAAGGVRANLTDQTSSGADGQDTLITIENLTGSGFADVLVGADDANKLFGGRGADDLLGRGGDDLLTGGGGNDSLDGGNGADVLIDGRGRDMLTGGGGADSFTFAAEVDIRGDRITDLGGQDVIDLSAVDGDENAGGHQGFHIVDKFSGVAGELDVQYSARHDWTKVSGDVDGDGRADFSIRIDGNHEGFDSFVL